MSDIRIETQNLLDDRDAINTPSRSMDTLVTESIKHSKLLTYAKGFTNYILLDINHNFNK